MAEYLKLARFYLLLLVIVTIGRWYISLNGVPYAAGTDKLSIVTMTIFASIFYGAFCRRWRGFIIAGPVSNAIAGMLGWAMGGLLPADPK